MTSKERMLAVLNDIIPDRVPWGEYAVDHDTVEKVLGHETYLRSKAKSAMALWEGRRAEVAQSWKEDLIALYRKLDFLDLINLRAMSSARLPPKDYQPEKPKKIAEGTWQFKDGRIYKYSDVTGDLSLVEDPMQWERVFKPEDYPLDEEPKPPDPSCFEVVDAVIREFRDKKFIFGTDGGEVSLHMLGGDIESMESMERGLAEYALNPDIVKRATQSALNRANKLDRYWVREGQDGIVWPIDFSSTSGSFISPEMFREFCLPAIKSRVANLKSMGVHVIKHACGNNTKLLDMFVEAGYEGYQAIQESAGIDLAWLKKSYGDRLVLWGGVNVEVLIGGTPEETRANVRRAMDILKPGGKYIFGSSHSIAIGTSYDNFMAMADEFLKTSWY